MVEQFHPGLYIAVRGKVGYMLGIAWQSLNAICPRGKAPRVRA